MPYPRFAFVLCLLISLSLPACNLLNPPVVVKDEVPAGTLTGIASYYGEEFHGRKTASGEVFDKDKLTAAHKTLPFQTQVEVTNLKNGKKVSVRINDRMPKTSKREIDLSEEAARRLGMLQDGVVRVSLRVLK
ncbi:MAG: septal ring lytic transglycosylase RlpA family protein [Microscillaceae bacterium]|nr:septal ring lytic transglycosylase RlpA family protein [Microscillaceae bacterium]